MLVSYAASVCAYYLEPLSIHMPVTNRDLAAMLSLLSMNAARLIPGFSSGLDTGVSLWRGSVHVQYEDAVSAKGLQ